MVKFIAVDKVEQKLSFSLVPPAPIQGKNKILFASRTHSQLAQAMKQLRLVAYAPDAVALGSRDALCCHPKVKEKPTLQEKNQTCNYLVRILHKRRNSSSITFSSSY